MSAPCRRAPLALVAAAAAVLMASGCDRPPEEGGGEEIERAEAAALVEARTRPVWEIPAGAEVLNMDDPTSAAAGPAAKDAQVGTLGTDCGGITNPCGIVYNRTRGTLQLSRDSGSRFYCAARGPYRDLPAGKNSNAWGSPHWPDVDCVRSRTAWVVTNGRAYPPGEWIRIWTSKWIYSL